MENKFHLTREQNVFIAKRNIVDYIWKSANLEGIGVTYPETQAIYDGGIVNGLTVDKIIAINNLKYAWQFILENRDIDYDFKVLLHIHKLTCDKLVLDNNLGKLRTTPVNIGGTTWKPQFPIESQIKKELAELLNQREKTKTGRGRPRSLRKAASAFYLGREEGNFAGFPPGSARNVENRKRKKQNRNQESPFRYSSRYLLAVAPSATAVTT